MKMYCEYTYVVQKYCGPKPLMMRTRGTPRNVVHMQNDEGPKEGALAVRSPASKPYRFGG